MRQPASQAVSPALDVTIVFGLACHLCTDAEDALAEFGTRLPLRVTRVAAASEAGRRLLMQHQAGLLPLVLINGRFLSSGRVPRGALDRIESDWTLTGAVR